MIKNEILAAYQPLLAVLTKADKLGFIVQVNVNKNALGKVEINQLKILKDFPYLTMQDLRAALSYAAHREKHQMIIYSK